MQGQAGPAEEECVVRTLIGGVAPAQSSIPRRALFRGLLEEVLGTSGFPVLADMDGRRGVVVV